ncbi:hypothetical protein EON81_19085, partial [bacterium]
MALFRLNSSRTPSHLFALASVVALSAAASVTRADVVTLDFDDLPEGEYVTTYKGVDFYEDLYVADDSYAFGGYKAHSGTQSLLSGEGAHGGKLASGTATGFSVWLSAAYLSYGDYY